MTHSAAFFAEAIRICTAMNVAGIDAFPQDLAALRERGGCLFILGVAAARATAAFRSSPPGNEGRDEAAGSLRRLREVGFVLAVVTNRPDGGNCVTAHSETDAMHEIMMRQLPLDAFRACYLGENGLRPCRKPKPGMLLDLAGELGIDLAASFTVGDRKSDVEAGRSTGRRTVFVDLGYAAELVP